MHELSIALSILDIAASEFGGYQEILSIHAEGSLAAQRITILRDYDVDRCVGIVKSYLEDRRPDAFR